MTKNVQSLTYIHFFLLDISTLGSCFSLLEINEDIDEGNDDISSVCSFPLSRSFTSLDIEMFDLGTFSTGI